MRLIFIGAFVLTLAKVWAQDEVHVSFDNLAELATTGPAGLWLDADRDIKTAGAKAALQWQNPALEAGHETVSSSGDAERETTLLAAKSFILPWAGRPHQDARLAEIDAAELSREHQQRLLLADLKTLYAEVQLKKQLQTRLEEFTGLVQQASYISSDRREQGTVSGLEDRVLQLSLFNVKGAMQQLTSDIRAGENRLKRQLGVTAPQSLVLDTPIEFRALELQAVAPAALAASPLLQQLAKQVERARHLLDMEKGNVLPEIQLSGGYKQINSDFRGGVLGLSLPLPVLNANRAGQARAAAELTAASIDYEQTRAQLIDLLGETTRRINEQQALLAPLAANQQAAQVPADLMLAFREGWLDLTDLLSSIQVYAETLQNYFSILSDYNANIFQLEALTGQTLVSF